MHRMIDVGLDVIVHTKMLDIVTQVSMHHGDLVDALTYQQSLTILTI